MDRLREVLARVGAVFRRRTRDEDFDRELSCHLGLAIQENLQRGLSPEEARRQALIRLGGMQQTRELHRETRELPIVDSVLQDVRYACRTLRREPTFALAVAITLSLGIGASTAVFGMLSTTLASRLPYPDADRLVVGTTSSHGTLERRPVSGLYYYDYRDSNHSFDGLAAFSVEAEPATITGSGDPWEADTRDVTWNLLRVLQVRPAAGKSFRAEDEVQADPGVVIISFGLWQSRFGGAADALGKTIVLDGSPCAIVGVLPRGFRFASVLPEGAPPGLHGDADIWRVVARPRQGPLSNNYYLVGRLRPLVTLAHAQRDVDAIARTLERAYPDTHASATVPPSVTKGRTLRLEPLHLYLGGGVRAGLLMPAAATACLLFVACANVAGLLLARGQRRTGELAMRSALGASRGRLVRQQLTESIVLTLPACVLGVGVAFVLQSLLLYLLPLDPLNVTHPVLDSAVLVFALGISLTTGLLVGLVPAVRGAARTLLPHLGTGRQAHRGEHGARLRGSLVVAQIAVSVVLLVGAGLVAHSFVRLSVVDFGFSADRLLTARVVIQGPAYRDRARRHAFFSSVLDEIRALPGVRSAAAANSLPLGPGSTWRTRTPDGVAVKQFEHTHLCRVSPGYFETMGMPLLEGRAIEDTDREGARPVAVLSETLARALYPHDSPVGRTVLLFDNTSLPMKDIPYEIAGVVRSARLAGPREDADPAMYLSVLQAYPRSLRIVVRTSGDPTAAIAPIREIVRRHDRDALVADVQAMNDVVDGSFTDFRRVVRYMGLCAAIALLLAAVGLYGALAYHVGQQEHEFGVRQALGATRARVLVLVLRRGGWLVLGGLVLGLAVAYPGTRLVRSVLFETAPLDPASYAGAALALLPVAAAACLMPALRATRVDPAVVLRSE
jgi:putative ABC transport system permease protein